jgi:hypothetical protein
MVEASWAISAYPGLRSPNFFNAEGVASVPPPFRILSQALIRSPPP